MSDSIAALFQRLTQGVYVVGVAHADVRNAFTAASVMQVSFDPLLLALSINPYHSSYGLLREGRAFSVNVLKKGQLDLAARYGGGLPRQQIGLMEQRTGRSGVPLSASLTLSWHSPGRHAPFHCRMLAARPLSGVKQT